MQSQNPVWSQSASASVKILFLEDTPTDFELEQHNLRRAGLDFVTLRVETASAFTDALCSFAPDIVIVDYQVPGFDGLEATRITKRRRPDLPVILVTGVLDDSAAGQFIEAGISDYVLKDRLARLPAAVKSALTKAEAFRARQRAEAARDELAHIVDCANSGVLGKNIDGLVTAWNASAAKFYGRTASEAIGHPIQEVLGSGYTTALDEALRGAERGGTISHIETIFRTGSGDNVDLSLSVSPIRDAGAKITGASIIVIDISEQKRMQRQLRQTSEQLSLSLQQFAQTNLSLQREIQVRRVAELEAAAARQQAESANQAKNAYLGHVSHEIRTPMTSIIGFADLLLDTELSDDQAQKVRYQRESAKSLLTIINDLLDISAIESGRLRLSAGPTDLRSTVDAVLATIRPNASARGLQLRCDVASDLPLWILVDAMRLRQILINLVCNAVKFTESGGVLVSVARDHETSGGFIRFEVIDTGIGIPSEKQANLFREFYRVQQPRSRDVEGSGLGLAISRRLVEAMGGSIDVTSREGDGTTFWFLLPLTSADQIPPRTLDQPAAGPGRKGRILVAEDLPMNQIIITAMLEAAGHTVTVVGDGQAAIAASQEGEFDLILMDMEMPVMGGLEAARTIRSAMGKRTPIVALTANAMPEQIGECRASGMNDHVSKPIDRSVLLSTVDNWIGQPSADLIWHQDISPVMLDHDIVDTLERQFGHDRLLQFMAMVGEQLETVIHLLPDCTDRTAAAHALHSLVSLAGNVGFRELSEQARALMTALQTDSGHVPDLATGFRTSAQAALSLLKTHYLTTALA